MSKQKVAIIGDSFAADSGPASWVTQLSVDFDIANYSKRGASEYRLYTTLVQNEQEIKSADYIVMFHTNSLRVFIPDDVNYPARQLASHTNCDLVINDALEDPQWEKIAETYLKYFFDEQQLRTQYRLLIGDINKRFDNRIIHCSGFDETVDTIPIKSFSQVRQSHPGTTNHLDHTGNLKVYQYIKEQLC